MLWHVEKGKMNLLGSIHVLDGPVALWPAAEDAYRGAKRLIVEMDIRARPDASPWLLPEADPLSRRIAPGLFAATAARWAEAKLTAANLERMPPWLAALALMEPLAAPRGVSRAHSVDLYFLNRAQTDGKDIVSLETTADAMDPFARAPVQEQTLFLSYIAEQTDESQAELNAMIVAWRARDVAYFDRLHESRMQMAPKMFGALSDERNRAWMPRLLAAVEDGIPTLVVVGALHFAGANGLLALLTKAGRRMVPK